ncbi:MAG TPA: hypothetical protein P5065_05570 [Candidatus Ratteibacteria bacterium]|nr:hypothetical protein [Candidatus Ratteibacteria bacterium]HRV04564.1 hypothetical protein [Candidatus Ratteibacteria bacterium]
MALFKRKTEEEKLEEILEKYGLNVDKYDTERIKEINKENLKKIGNELIGSKWFELGFALSFSSAETALVTHLRALIEQNWILIRQNEIIIRELQRNKSGEK